MIGFGIITEYQFVQKKSNSPSDVKGASGASNGTCMDALGNRKIDLARRSVVVPSLGLVQ
jgi:hypothetical protein